MSVFANAQFVHSVLANPNFFSITSAAILVLISIFSYLRLHGGSKSLSFPVHGNAPEDADLGKTRWMSDVIQLLEEGYHKFSGAFQVWTTEGMQLVVPPRYIDELKMLPDHTMESALFQVLQMNYTMPQVKAHDFLMNRIVKVELNKHLPKLVPLLKEELDHALSTELNLGESKEWTPAIIHPRVIHIICRMMGRIFVGPALSRNKEWIETSCNFTLDAFSGGNALRVYPTFLRPVAKYFVPQLQRVRKHHRVIARKYLIPIIKERQQQERELGGAYEKPDDAIEWVRDMLPADAKNDFEYQALVQLAFGAAAIHTTSQMVTNIIYDLAARPEYISLLRDEVRSVIAAHGGEMSTDSLHEMLMVDSFMKESQRFVGAIPVSFNRRVLKPLTLSDGVQIPAGTLLMAPSLAISHSPAVYKSPEVFDGLRYHKLRTASPAEANKHQFTSTSSSMMHFGGGRHACPGRFFASHEIKMIVSTLLLNYDFKYPEGQGRPKNILVQTQHMPNPRQELLFKRL